MHTFLSNTFVLTLQEPGRQAQFIKPLKEYACVVLLMFFLPDLCSWMIHICCDGIDIYLFECFYKKQTDTIMGFSSILRLFHLNGNTFDLISFQSFQLRKFPYSSDLYLFLFCDGFLTFFL